MSYREITTHHQHTESPQDALYKQLDEIRGSNEGFAEEYYHPKPKPNPHATKGNAENNYSTQLNPEEQAVQHHQVVHLTKTVNIIVCIIIFFILCIIIIKHYVKSRKVNRIQLMKTK